MADKAQSTDAASTGETPAASAAAVPARRGPGHRGADVRDTVAEMAARAHEISQEAGSKMAAAMKDVINAAAGLAGFAVESARDLVQYMVRRGQMTQEEADKLLREAEDAFAKRKPAAAAPSSNGDAPGRGDRERTVSTRAEPVARASAPAIKRAEPRAAERHEVTPQAKPEPKSEVRQEAKPAAKPASKAPAVKAPAAKTPAVKAPPAKAPPAKVAPAKVAPRLAAKAPVKAAAKAPVKVAAKAPAKSAARAPAKGSAKKGGSSAKKTAAKRK
jgi:hypothetical protein